MHSSISPKSIWAPLTGDIIASRLRVDHNGTVTWDRGVQYGWALQQLITPAVAATDNTPAVDAVYADIPSARGTIEMSGTDYLNWPDGVPDESYILPYTASKIGVTLTT